MPQLTCHIKPASMREQIEAYTTRFGWMPEHNATYFLNSEEPGLENLFFTTPEGWGLFIQFSRKDNEWDVFVEPLAPPEERAPIILAFCEYAFSHAAAKVTMETSPQTRRALLPLLPHAQLRSCAIAETLIWPVLDLTAHDPAYPGSQFKPIRNARSRFVREHAVSYVDATAVPAVDLHAVIDSWDKQRPARHHTITTEYHAWIDAGFRDACFAKALMVDGRPEAYSAGWIIPNSNTYYLAVSLHSYAHWGLGEFAMSEELAFLKSQNIKSVNLGGSDKKLLAFKQQFGATETYKTHYFSVVRKK